MSGRLPPGIKPADYIRLAIAEPGRSVLRPYQQQNWFSKRGPGLARVLFSLTTDVACQSANRQSPPFFSI